MFDDGIAHPWRCSMCGKIHDTLPAVVSMSPAYWDWASEQERISEFELTSDTCVWDDKYFFVRCVLEIPFIDRDGTLDFGVWASLSPENFRSYMKVFDSPNRAGLEAMFGYFSNSLPGFSDTMNLKCDVVPRESGLRPILELHANAHPLVHWQESGIRFDQAVAYVHEHLGI